MIFTPLVMFYSLIMISLILSLSSNSSLMMWVSLEVNMLSFLPIMSSNDLSPFENTMKYFLVQSLASIMFITVTMMSMFKYKYSMESVLILSMALKLGMAPFHSWFIMIMKMTNLHNLFLLSTLQKFIPLVIISSFNMKYNLILALFILNSFVISVNSMETMSIMKILGFSSINNLMWMMLAVLASNKVFILFMLMYMYMLMGLLFFDPLKMNFRFLRTFKLYDKFLLTFVFFSLGGLPPFVGFMMKVMVIKKSILMLSLMVFMPIVVSSLIILYMYMSYSFLNITLSPLSMISLNFYSYSPLKFIYFMSSLGLSVIMCLPF